MNCSDIDQKLQEKLASIPAPIPDGYERRMMSFITRLEQDQAATSARIQNRPEQKPGKLAWFASGFASAAILCLLVGSWLIWNNSSSSSVSVGSIYLAPMKTRNISLVFRVPGDMEKATLRIDLPGDVELKGYPGKRTITWKTSLKHGTNKLVLPLMATGSRGGELKASVTWKGKTKVFWLGLSVIQQSTLNYTIRPNHAG
jgi:hypothetical protein